MWKKKRNFENDDDWGWGFGKNFLSKIKFERTELIKPYLERIDERGIDYGMDRHVQAIDRDRIVKNRIIPDINDTSGRTLDSDEIKSKINAIYNKLPKELIHDIFNQYYTPIDKLKYENREEKNKFRYMMVDKSNDPIIKTMTVDSGIRSLIFTQNMIEYFLYTMVKLSYKDPQEFEKMMSQLSSGTGDSSEMQKALDGLIRKDSTRGGLLDRMIQETMEKVDNLEQILGDEKMEDIWKDIQGNNAGDSEAAVNKLDAKYLNNMRQKLNSISMNMNAIKEPIKKLLDKALSSFSAKEEPIFENFLDNLSIDTIIDHELLHPRLRALLLDNIQSKDIKKVGKINVYVDISTSMNNGANISGADSITRGLFAKALLYKLKQLDLIEKVYLFNADVHESSNDILSILAYKNTGGTSLETVVNHIEKYKENSIIITDGEDQINTYSPYAFFIGVAGADFYNTSAPAKQSYGENRQMVVFNGEKISYMDENGVMI